MRRRQFLAVTALSASTAGCGFRPGSSGHSRFAGEPCPEIRGSPTCFHSSDPLGEPLLLVPEHERVESPSTPLRFELVNRSEWAVTVDVSFPLLARRLDGLWQRIPHRRQDTQDIATVSSGDGHVFGLVNGAWYELAGADATTSENYGAGEFAFVVQLLEPTRTLLARFTVEGESKTVSPPGSVTTERDGATLVVSHPEADHERYPLTVEFRTETVTPAATTLVPEVVNGRWELRSAAFLRRSGVETVRVRTQEDYFRTPIEWLEAAGVPIDGDQRYAIGDLGFSLEQWSG